MIFGPLRSPSGRPSAKSSAGERPTLFHAAHARSMVLNEWSSFIRACPASYFETVGGFSFKPFFSVAGLNGCRRGWVGGGLRGGGSLEVPGVSELSQADQHATFRVLFTSSGAGRRPRSIDSANSPNESQIHRRLRDSNPQPAPPRPPPSHFTDSDLPALFDQFRDEKTTVKSTAFDHHLLPPPVTTTHRSRSEECSTERRFHVAGSGRESRRHYSMTTVNAITRFAYEEHAALVPLFTCTLLVRETKTNARAKSNRRMKPTKSTDAANTHAHTHTHTHTHTRTKRKKTRQEKKRIGKDFGGLYEESARASSCPLRVEISSPPFQTQPPL